MSIGVVSQDISVSGGTPTRQSYTPTVTPVEGSLVGTPTITHAYYVNWGYKLDIDLVIDGIVFSADTLGFYISTPSNFTPIQYGSVLSHEVIQSSVLYYTDDYLVVSAVSGQELELRREGGTLQYADGVSTKVTVTGSLWIQ